MKKFLLTVVAVLGVVAPSSSFANSIGGWFWHPLAEGANSTCSEANDTGSGYRMPHPVHGHPVCRKHHPDGEARGEFLKAERHSLEAHAAVAEQMKSPPPRPDEAHAP